MRYSKVNSISVYTNIIINVIFLITSILCIYPLLLVLSASFSDELTFDKTGFTLIPQKLSVYAYQFLLQNTSQVFRSYAVSFIVTVLGTVTSLLLISLYAYPISRREFKYKNVFSFFVFFTMLFNGGLIPWYLVYVKMLGVKNSLLVLILPYTVVPFYVLIMKSFFKTTINDSILESAKIDGCGDLRTFFAIVLPLSKPGLATIGLFSTLSYWNDWYLGLIFITDNRLIPLQYLMYQVQGSIQFLVSAGSSAATGDILAKLPSETSRMAMAIVSIGPIIFAYPFFQKYYIKGLTLGAIKG